MTTSKRLQFQIHLPDSETEAMTWSLANTERITTHLEREIYGITSNEQKWFKMEFSFRLIELESWQQTIGIQVQQTIIEQGVIHFGYQKMHLVSSMSE